MKTNLTVVLLLFRLIATGQGEASTGIIYGKNHAFELTAPTGWVLDNKSGVKQGLHAVFYRQGETWQKATTVMYANTASLEDAAHKTLEDLIMFDLNNFRRQYADLLISDASDIKIKDDLAAIVKYLSGKSYGNYEAMAYINAGKTGVMIIMSSRTKEDFDNSLSAFISLVKSYFLIADKVVIGK